MGAVGYSQRLLLAAGSLMAGVAATHCGGPRGPGNAATVIEAVDPPPPISGGTLWVSPDGHTAVASDPDRDQIYVVDLANPGARTTIRTELHDEPGRVVADAAGRVHIVLRRGGAVLSVDLASRSVVGRRSVCAAPRGIAFDTERGRLWIVCAGGRLVSLPVLEAAPRTEFELEPDLRDVVISGGRLYVTTFRSAAILDVDPSTGIVRRRVVPTFLATAATSDGGVGTPGAGLPATPPVAHVAWRALADGRGGLAVLHQAQATAASRATRGGYGGFCGSAAMSLGVVTRIVGPDAPAMPTQHALVPPPYADFALSADGRTIAFVSPSTHALMPSFYVAPLADPPPASASLLQCRTIPFSRPLLGQNVAVAFVSANRVVVQSREPAELTVMDVVGGVLPTVVARIALSAVSRSDTGHSLFNLATGGGIACASCHPEGGDDGHAWTLEGRGARRTQSLRGGITGSEPFHWDGDMRDASHLLHEVFGSRMAGGEIDEEHVRAFARWIDAIPTVPQDAPRDASQVARGRVLFNDTTVNCVGCHGGPTFTNNITIDVGTGGSFQVPSLTGVAFRAPFMHSGCAETLRDRFGTCGGGDRHGMTSHLAGDQVDDLVAYLRTL